MPKFAGWVVLGLLCSPARAERCEMPVTGIADDAPSFATAQAAAVAALTQLSTPFAESEWGGVIIERGGRFYATTPVTTGLSTALDFRVRKAATDRVAATYHTHPIPDCGGETGGNGFSRGDVEVSRKMQVPAYMATEFARQIRVFDPLTSARRPGDEKTLGQYVLPLSE